MRGFLMGSHMTRFATKQEVANGRDDEHPVTPVGVHEAMRGPVPLATGTDDYTTPRSLVSRDRQIARVQIENANTGTTPTLNGDTVTAWDGSVLWGGALDGFHHFQRSSSAWLVLDPRWQTASFWAGQIDGGQLSNNATDSDHDIDIDPIVAWLKDGAGNRKAFQTTATLTKQIDANWAEGTDAGGFPSALTLGPDTYYDVFVIGTDNGAVDAGFDTDASAANLLADASSYSWFRRILSVLTDGSSNIIAFHQYGDHVFLDAPMIEVNDNNIPNQTITVSVPQGRPVRGIFNAGPHMDSSANQDMDVTLSSPVDGSRIHTSATYRAGTGSRNFLSQGIVTTNASGQVDLTLSDPNSGGEGAYVETLGWIDDRGRNA